MDALLLECPHCARPAIDVHRYESMIVISRDLALFTCVCPACGSGITSVRPIPTDMSELVQSAASKVGAGMGMSR